MVTSKIITLLKGFSENDISSLREFLLSPYFNKKKKLVSYFEYLVKFHPGFAEDRTNKKAVYKKLFPKSRFNEQVFKNLSSELYHLANEFLAIQKFRTQKVQKEMNTLKALDERGVDTLFEIEFKKLDSYLNDALYYDELYYDRFELKDMRLLYLYNRNRQKDGIYNTVQWGDELFKFFIISISRVLFGLSINRVIFNAQYEENVSEVFIRDALNTGSINASIEFLEKNKIEGWEITLIRYNMALAMMFPNDENYYNRAKKLLLDNIIKFTGEQASLMTNALFTVCTRKINEEESIANYTRAFEIIEFQLEKRLHKTSTEDHITVYKYRNIFMIALFLGKTKWLEGFVKDHVKEVAPENRASLKEHSAAYLKFINGEYESSLEHLSKIKFDQFIYKLDVKSLSLLNYYELGYYENARALLASFRQFLNTNKFVSAVFRTSYMNVLDRYNKLISLTEKFDEKLYTALKQENDYRANKFLKDWLSIKLDELHDIFKSEHRKK